MDTTQQTTTVAWPSPRNSGDTLNTPTGPSDANCPTADSITNSGMPRIITKIAYGIRNAPKPTLSYGTHTPTQAHSTHRYSGI